MRIVDVTDAAVANPEAAAQAWCDRTDGGIKDHAGHIEVIYHDGDWQSVVIPTK